MTPSVGSAGRWQFDIGPATVTIDATGVAADVRHAELPGVSYLTGHPGAALDPAAQGRIVDVRADVDEIEVVHETVGPAAGAVLRHAIRHTFAPGWSVRLVWSNVGDVACALDEAGVHFQPGPRCLAWGVAAGEDSGTAVLPLERPGPVLGGRLRRGRGERLGPDGLTVAPVILPPGGSTVVHWEWDWYPTPQAYSRGRHPAVPWALTAAAGEPITVPAGPDVVLLVDGQVVDDERESVELDDHSRPRRVEVRSAAGTTAYEVDWAPPIDELIDAAVDAALAGDRLPTGVARLPGLDHALLVQQTLARGRCEDPWSAEDALDAFSAVRGTAPVDERADPLLAVFWCNEYARTGDLEYVEAASRVVLAQSRLRPGVGLAGVQTVLTCSAAGVPALAVRRRLVALSRPVGTASGDRTPGAAGGDPASLAGIAAGLELLVGVAEDEISVELLLLGRYLGAGLKGRPARPIDPLERSHAVAVVQALPEGAAAALVPEWGCSLLDLARRESAAVTAELTRTEPPGSAAFARALAYLGWSRL